MSLDHLLSPCGGRSTLDNEKLEQVGGRHIAPGAMTIELSLAAGSMLGEGGASGVYMPSVRKPRLALITLVLSAAVVLGALGAHVVLEAQMSCTSGLLEVMTADLEGGNHRHTHSLGQLCLIQTGTFFFRLATP